MTFFILMVLVLADALRKPTPVLFAAFPCVWPPAWIVGLSFWHPGFVLGGYVRAGRLEEAQGSERMKLAKIQKKQDLADMKRKMANFIRLLRLACGPMRLFYLCSGGNYPSCEADTETGLALCGRGGFR